MPNSHGSFIWYELLTADPAAAETFYTEVVGWSASSYAGAVTGYRILSAPDGGVAGLMALPDGAEANGIRPGWFGYLGVHDVDATLGAVETAGGRVAMPAMDLPGVGRIALVADPQGVLIYVMRGASDQASTSFSTHAIGHCSWNELVTRDVPGALHFYGTLFGITKGEVMPMGDMGDYQFVHHAGERIGAMMTRPQGGPAPAWGFYFRVPDIAAAHARVTAGGGRVLHGPQEVPGGERVILALDPQGVPFGLVAPAAVA